MKKVVLILLIFVYSLSAFGVGLKQFYCCGKLTSVTFTLTADTKDKQGKADSKAGCCKTKHLFFKVRDNHNVMGELTTPRKSCTDVTSFDPTPHDIGFSAQQVDILNGSHAPPLSTVLPIYLLNCVFRI